MRKKKRRVQTIYSELRYTRYKANTNEVERVLKTIAQKLRICLQSKRFFQLSLVLFFINAGWLALTALYPMAYDENYHLGLIRLYSHRLLPFWSAQPTGDAVYGAVARDPSYMYHYLLSFPYRILEYFVKSETSQVISLRLFSIICFGVGIWIFRKILLGAGFSKALTHLALFLFILTPLVPFLAAQINYDPLTFLLLAIVINQTQQLLSIIKTTKKIDIKKVLILAIVCLFASLVKYAFLPIVLALFFTLLWQVRKQNKQSWFAFAKTHIATFTQLSAATKVVLLSIVVLLLGLCFERYGINTIRYHTPTPECDQVLSIDNCMAYGPWRRNFLTHQDKLQGKLVPVSTNPFSYFVTIWLSQTTYQLFYTLNGAKSNFQVGRSYRVTRIASVTVFLVGTALFIYQYAWLRKRYEVTLLLSVMLFYVGSLLAQNYMDFIHLGLAVAIQGRYLIPILPIVYILVGASFARILRKQPSIKAGLAGLAMIIILTQAGGATTYILRSDSSWFWPNKTIIQANDKIKKILRLTVIGN